jgi:predicted phage terminase large subunit-like protein
MLDSKYLKLLDNYEVHCLRIIKLAAVDGSETKEQQKKRIAELEKDYIKWFEYYFPQYAKRKCAWFHRKLAKAIIRNKRIRCLAEIYRSGAKSVHICMGIPLFLYLVMGELNFMMLIGETDPKAKKLISGIQAELEVNPRILNDYGRRMMEGDWSDGHFITNDGVRFMSLGFNQDPRGSREGANRPDYIVIDDVDSKRHMNNDEMMAGGVDKITEDIEGCFDADSDESTIERMVYSNNNTHKNCITNRLKKEYLNNIKRDIEEGVKTDYEIITVTAVKDLINFEPNWPEKTNAEFWRRKYKRKPKSFMREYMHMHIEDGKVFKPETMQWCKMLPLKDYDALFLYGDLSYKDQADYKAMILCGKKGREIHVIHTLCRQTSRTGVAQWTYDLWERRNLSEVNVKIQIEGLFAMDEFVSDFDNEGDERGYHIPVVADKRGKENKYNRIESIESYFQRRWIFFNEKEKDHSDQITLYDQLIGFSKGSKLNDDGPDCLHGCIDGLNRETFSSKFEPRIHKRTFRNKRY